MCGLREYRVLRATSRTGGSRSGPTGRPTVSVFCVSPWAMGECRDACGSHQSPRTCLAWQRSTHVCLDRLSCSGLSLMCWGRNAPGTRTRNIRGSAELGGRSELAATQDSKRWSRKKIRRCVGADQLLSLLIRLTLLGKKSFPVWEIFLTFLIWSASFLRFLTFRVSALRRTV